MKNKFEELVKGLCILKNLGDPVPHINGAPINVNGTMCVLIYNEAKDADRFFLYVIFGYAPQGSEALVLKTLLQYNHDGYEGSGPGFCISATTGKVGHVISVQLDDARPDQLASSMAYYADKAAGWRETFFLRARPTRPRQGRLAKNCAWE